MTIDMLNRATGHEWDDDACCIHCGFDGAEWRHLREEGEPMPMCEVNYWRMAQQESPPLAAEKEKQG